MVTLDEVRQPLNPHLPTSVILCRKIAGFEAQAEPYLMAPYTVLWYCSPYIPYGKFANLWQ
ncbi:MAG: hypothetical protein ACK4HM_05365 [Thermosynechococcus sp.]